MKKKEVTLTNRDYNDIKQGAHDHWIHDTHTGGNFLAKCITKSFLGFTNKNNLLVENGQIYEQKQDTKND